MQALPKTIYLWLAVLVASMLAGNWLGAETKPATPTEKTQKTEKKARAALSGPSFDRYLEAERLTRTHYALSALGGADTLPQARTIYREIALKTDQPNPARKALILGHQLKQPLDPVMLQQLPAYEHLLWQSLYGAPPAPPVPVNAEAQIKAMKLRFLDNQALADLYHRQGDTRAAKAAEARRDEQAQSSVLRRLIPLGLLAVLGGIAGLGLLLFAGFVALRREWHLLGCLPEPAEPKLGWGELLDVFVFYLASYRAIGLLAIFLLPAQAALIPLQVGAQFLSGFLAIGYLVTKARRSGASLVELGWSGERLGSNIAYGIGGYVATLPLIAVLGMLSKWIFQNSSNTSPNPAMALMGGQNTALEQVLLFVTISVGAPLFEEFFFRGVLFTGLRRRFAALPSILLSTVVFACVHPTQDWLPILGLGFSFAVMRHLRQSLVPGITAHFLQNTVTFLFLRAIFGE